MKSTIISFDQDETIIDIPDHSCNDTDKFIDISKMKNLTTLKIGTYSFLGISKFSIDNMNELKTISIGFHSFTTSCNPKPGGLFNVSNCEKLESITLEYFTFSHYTDGFTLTNLPSLKYLRIGKVGTYSLNFNWVSFCLKGMNERRARIVNRFTETGIVGVGE